MFSMSRRTFLVASAGVAFAAAGRESLAALPPFIDTHTHFYDPTRPQGVPWPSKNDPLLYRTVLPAEFKKLSAPLGITGTVVVEASPWVEDNQFILDLAKDEPYIVGLCGNLKPGDAEFAQHLARFSKNPLFRGIRVVGAEWPKRVEDVKFVDDLKRMVDADLELDVNTTAANLPAVAAVADKLPKLRMVLNHAANTPIDGQAVKPQWLDGMKALGGRKNVFAKVSGLVEGTGKRNGDAPADVAYYKPVLDVLWEQFGEDRLIFGSNWPVSARFAPLDRIVAIVRGYFEPKGPAVLAKVLGGNSVAAYKWVKR